MSYKKTKPLFIGFIAILFLFSLVQGAAAQEFTEIPETINLPFIGELKTASVSLPILTVIIGALDGFNPCAMWVLLFLISFYL